MKSASEIPRCCFSRFSGEGESKGGILPFLISASEEQGGGELCS